VDRYVADDVAQIRQQVSALLQQGLPAQPRSQRPNCSCNGWRVWTPGRKSSLRWFAICIKESAHECVFPERLELVQRLECWHQSGRRFAGLAEGGGWRSR
jgi:hypothetical protein